MAELKINFKRTYTFIAGGDCDDCDLRDYCYDVFDDECEGGEAGHYHMDDEEIEQLDL